MSERLTDILACPICKGPLLWLHDSQEYVCRADRLAFPVRDGIPVMLPEEARRLSAEDSALERR
ncbi:MAG TPA: Trm112 family protein [Steroidobacteraceae bacterium]|nr:Trm112 family protein [Steroidobacteraceae bacterium]